MHRLRAQLARFEDAFPGFRTEIVEGSVVARPVRPCDGVRGDYEVKDRQYAARGIPNYLIFDPRRGHVVSLRNPGPGGYRRRDVFPYGGEVTVEARIGRLTVGTSCLPLSPESPGGGRRTPLPPPPGGPGGGPAS